MFLANLIKLIYIRNVTKIYNTYILNFEFVFYISEKYIYKNMYIYNLTIKIELCFDQWFFV